MSHVFCFSFSLGPWKFSKGSLLYETKAPLRGERIVEGFPKTMGLYTQLAYHPVEGSHVCVVGEGACILFPEPGLSHFNLSLPPPLPMGRRERKGPPPLPPPPHREEQCLWDCVAGFTENRLWEGDYFYFSFCRGRQGGLIETSSLSAALQGEKTRLRLSV